QTQSLLFALPPGKKFGEIWSLWPNSLPGFWTELQSPNRRLWAKPARREAGRFEFRFSAGGVQALIKLMLSVLMSGHLRHISKIQTPSRKGLECGDRELTGRLAIPKKSKT